MSLPQLAFSSRILQLSQPWQPFNFTFRALFACCLLSASLLTTACDPMDPLGEQAQIIAEGKAIGSACRHSGRALEDCYALNDQAEKAAIFSGWKEMDGYMRENNIAIVPSSEHLPVPAAVTEAGTSPETPATETPTGSENAAASSTEAISTSPASTTRP